ncbi:MAG: hypothetical protein WCO52_03755 [bacterium]
MDDVTTAPVSTSAPANANLQELSNEELEILEKVLGDEARDADALIKEFDDSVLAAVKQGDEEMTKLESEIDLAEADIKKDLEEQAAQAARHDLQP